MAGWRVEHHRGGAGVLHALDPGQDPVRRVLVLEVTRPALVLGSTQATEVVDASEARVRGIEIVRRRSGGGAVLLEPGRALWIDVVIPAGDPCWRDDVVEATRVVGAAWAAALRDLGLDAVVVDPGRPRPDPLARVVCFAGLGPGEVTVGGRKVVGLSQRRTRAWARVQGALVTAGGTATLRSLLAPGLRAAGLDGTRPWPPMGLAGPPPPVDALAERLADRLC